MKLSQLVLSSLNARKEYPPELVQDLAESIREDGLISKLILRETGTGSYEILGGGRRWHALVSVYGEDYELPSSDYLIKNVDDISALRISITENVQRLNFSPLELARAAEQLKEKDPSISNDDIARILWITVARVKRLLRLKDHVEELPDVAVRSLNTPDEQDPSFTDAHVEAMSKAGAFPMGDQVIKDVCDLIITNEIPASKVAATVERFSPKSQEQEEGEDGKGPGEAPEEQPMQDKYNGEVRMDGDQILIVSKKGEEPFDPSYYLPYVENRDQFRVFVNLKINIKTVGDGVMDAE